MKIKNKRHTNKYNKEEMGRIVGVFEWLIKEDKKQNPGLYTNQNSKYEKKEK